MSANFPFSKFEEQGIEINVRKQRGNAEETPEKNNHLINFQPKLFAIRLVR
jgi:hypothetical protein